MIRVAAAHKLVLLRYELGLSQRGMCELTEITERLLRAAEHGQDLITVQQAERLAMQARARFEALLPRERSRLRNQNRRSQTEASRGARSKARRPGTGSLTRP